MSTSSEHRLPPHLSRPPSGPLEILVPDDPAPAEPPRFAGKLISFLVAATADVNTIEFDGQGRSARTSDGRLQQFLNQLAEYGELGRLISHCRSIMYRAEEEGALGWLGAVQEEWAYTFVVYERAALPNPTWEIRRSVRRVQQ
jgi:hypothetical protein